MSVGLYKHPTLGQTKKYILNNKQVLEIKMDTKQTEDWSQQLINFKQQYLRNKQIKFYLLPQEVYVDKEAAYEYEQNSKTDSLRVIVYQHFIVTLKEEMQMRIKLKQNFTKSELWFFLYALSCGAMEMIQIHAFSKSSEDIDINPQTILLNEYGYIKMLGFYSTPFTVKCRSSYKSPESYLNTEALPQKLEICCSAALARIVSSLILLKEMDEFLDGKLKLFSDTKLLEELKPFEEQLGLLYNILRLMLADNLNDRLMISEVKALLLPYEDQILSLKDFTLDSELSRQSMIDLFVSE